MSRCDSRIIVLSVWLLASTSASAQQPQVLFVNPCTGGCEFSLGLDDSSINRSSIIPGTVQVSQYQHSEASFEEVVACLRTTFAPFDIAITEEDPAPSSHLELVIAGRPKEVGLDATVGEVTPFTCNVVENGIGFAFANLFGDSPPVICSVAAHAAGHLLGLEHAFLCEDVMTFLSGCGLPKSFVDQDVACGENQARPCSCRGSTQNSFQHLIATVPEPGAAALQLAALLAVCAVRVENSRRRV